MKKKIIVAYSGGLTSTALIPWLKENQECEITAVCVDVGQKVDWKLLQKQAIAAGASACHVLDAKKEYIEDFYWPILKAGVIQKDKHILGNLITKPLIAKTLAEYIRKEKASAFAHGDRCYSSDINCVFKLLIPSVEIIDPWMKWKLVNRLDKIRYLTRRKVPLSVKKNDLSSRESNLLSSSYTGPDLLDSSAEPMYRKILCSVVVPEKAPNKPEIAEIEFDKGIPTALNGKKMEGAALILQLNKIGAANGIGIADMIENLWCNTKTRTVYESPAHCILYLAHQKLESVCLDKQTIEFKQNASLEIGSLIDSSSWFSTLREALSSFVDITQKDVSGKVRLKLYKGSVTAEGVSSPNSLLLSGFNLETETKAKTGARTAKAVKGASKTAGKPAAKTAAAKTKTAKKPARKK